MIFWDASAVLPLCVQEDPSPLVQDLLLGDPAMVVWWGTPIECCSALARLQREGHLDRQAVSRAVRFLDSLREGWSEILPSHQVREGALRCISVHGLKAADSLQLAAAMVWSNYRPTGHFFACFDKRLQQAAHNEGFRIVPIREG